MIEAQSDVDIVWRFEQENSAPRVTVAVTVYNYRQYVDSCLDTVASQTLAALDLIVVDDCSADNSAEVIREWMDRHKQRFQRCLFVRHQVNKGLAAARNTGFHQARTAYVFVLDIDNLLYPRCLERLAAALDNCDASFAYCYLEKFGKEVNLHNKCPWNPSSFKYNNTIDAMVLLRKQVWQEVGGYSKMAVMGWEDFDLWFKIARNNGSGILVHEILARYRVHRRSMLHTVTNPKIKQLWAYLRATYPEFF